MSRQRPLRGACNCGRNLYTIIVPTSAADSERAQVLFDDSSRFRRAQATPLTAWLRVPIDWVSSTTVAQFPNESHSSIRRTFTPDEDPNCKRIFCGFCGTHLSYWTEQPPAEAEYLSITLGSLLSEDIHVLEELDLLPEDTTPDDLGVAHINTDGAAESSQLTTVSQDPSATQRGTRTGHSWFEEMLNGSRLGRTKRIGWGMGDSADGNTQVSWEVSEYLEGDEGETPISNAAGSKRKIEDIGGDDVAMKQ